MSIEEIMSLPATVDVPTAGLPFKLGRAKSYKLAREGNFPCRVIKVGRNYRVPKADLLRALGLEPPG